MATSQNMYISHMPIKKMGESIKFCVKVQNRISVILQQGCLIFECVFQIYNLPLMSLHCTFLYPKSDFHLIFMNTIGYISDNIFYRLNLETGQTQVQLNPKGRSYQSFTANYKRGLVVLADYGKNPNIYFDFMHKKQASYQIKDVCDLQIDKLSLSLDCRYLLVTCGVPEKKMLVVDVETKKLFKGKQSQVDLSDRKVIKAEFNPGNNKIFAVMYEKQIEIYQIEEIFKTQQEEKKKNKDHQQNNKDQKLQQQIKITKKGTLNSDTTFQTFIWDEINNLYVSNGKHVYVYSTDTQTEVIHYDLEGDFDGQVIANFVLTQKHLILLYMNGRIEWINKYYPDLMEEEEISQKPFYLDKYYEFSHPINYGLYNHQFTKLFVAHKNGFFSIINKQAQSNQNEQDQQQNKAANSGKTDKNKKLQADVSQVGPYHANQIVFCRQVKDKPILMTISKAGRIVLWSLIEKKPIAYSETASQVVSADVNENFTILVTSNKTGAIQFYSILDFTNIFLFKELKLIQKGIINQVLFSSNSQELACLSIQNKRVFYVLTDEGQDIQVLGFINLPYAPVSICWNRTTKTLVKANFQHLLVCIGFGILMINGPVASSAKLRGKHFNMNWDIYALRTDPEQKRLEVLPGGQIISTGSDKILKKYKQPEDPLSKFNPESKSVVPAPIEEIEAHDLETTFLKVHNKTFISGGADGTLHIRSIQNFSAVKSLHVSGWRNANLFTGAISNVDGLYYTCGKDGALCFWKTKDNLQVKGTDEIKKQKSKYNKIKSSGNSLKYFEDAVEDEYFEKMKDVIIKKKKDQLQKVTKIKSQLRQLLALNEGHDELERLSRDEFVIDIESRDIMSKRGMENCEKIKKESLKKVLTNEVYRSKLKEITWDTMQEHLKAINGIKNKYIVYNYQIRKLTYEQRRKLQIIMDLRRNQIRELKKRQTQAGFDVSFYNNKNVINGGIVQPLILTAVEKKDEKKDEKGKKKKEEEAVEKQPQQVEEIPKDEVWQLLYSSFELFSDNSKKNQIIMMKNLIVKIKEAFNKQFNKLLKLRQSQNQLINDKNKRIIEICDQLKRNHEVIVSNKNILENPDRILEISNKDIPFERYLSRQERQKLEKERLKQEERLRALAQDDSSLRALQKMMGGTLQEKKTSVLQVTVEREKWMDKPLQDMTEDQKNKLKQYEQKRQKAEQEKQRIVKKLEAELRKLKIQIDDTMEKYDEKLFTLLRRRIEYDLRIEQQELYCIKLSLSIQNFKQDSQLYQELKKKKQDYERKIKKLQLERERLKNYEQQLEKAKESKKASLDMKRLGEAETKVKTIEKSVFDEYNSNIKKRRQLQEKLLQNNQIVKYQIIPLDPMKQLQSRVLSNQNSQKFKFFLQQIKSFQQTYEFPDSLINVLESRFNNRKEEAELQRKLKNLRESIKSQEQQLSYIRQKQHQDHKQIEKLENSIKQSKSDIQILFRIKKGLVQIDAQTPVPKLQDALLINKPQIDSKNASIMEKANLKIGVMEQIKTCKISVTQQTLELERKQALINELSSMIKQVQMLKVKKQMQTALAKKDTKINQNELRSLKEQIEKVRKEGQKRINLFEKKIEKVSQQIESIRKENKQLEVQRWNLDNTVKQREKIKDMMVGQNGKGNQQAQEKFEQISINRKLFDKAKQQTDEIELLRQQLSKLKAKTFANFSSVQR